MGNLTLQNNPDLRFLVAALSQKFLCSFFVYDDEKDYAPTGNMNNSNLLSTVPSSILFTPPLYFLLTSHPHPSKSIYVIEYCNTAKSMRLHYKWAECRSLRDNVSFIYLPLFVLDHSKKR